MKAPKKYARGEPMPIAARGSAKLLRKIDKLHTLTFGRAYRRLVDREHKIARKK